MIGEQQGSQGSDSPSNDGFISATKFEDESIGLNWQCQVDVGESGVSQNLLPAGQKSQQWKFKVIRCEKTIRWLQSYVQEQSDRDEIMLYGSSNRNESINSKYAVKASKMNDFR